MLPATIFSSGDADVDLGFGLFWRTSIKLEGGPPPPGVNCYEATQSGRVVKWKRALPGAEPTFRFPAVVARVVDGDTIWFDVDVNLAAPRALTYRALVRVDGVNCPESHGPAACRAGKVAAAFTEGLLSPGTKVTVTTRRVHARLLGHGEKVEIHGRYLAAVTLPDGRDLTGVLISSGNGAEYHGVGKVVP